MNEQLLALIRSTNPQTVAEQLCSVQPVSNATFEAAHIMMNTKWELRNGSQENNKAEEGISG